MQTSVPHQRLVELKNNFVWSCACTVPHNKFPLPNLTKKERKHPITNSHKCIADEVNTRNSATSEFIVALSPLGNWLTSLVFSICFICRTYNIRFDFNTFKELATEYE